MKSFSSKQEVFDYLKEKYSNAKAIVIQGSTAKGDIKEFSDIDLIFYQDKPAKPEYELILVNNKLVLISAYPYKAGKRLKEIPENALVLKGEYYEQIDNQTEYDKKERVLRDNQMFLDFLFKYLRTKDIKYLDNLDKYRRI